MSSESSIDRKFAAFHHENPHVYRVLRTLALEARRRHMKFGIKALFEIARWERRFETSDPDFKLNNNYTARYARMLMENEPVLSGFFHVRMLRS